MGIVSRVRSFLLQLALIVIGVLFILGGIVIALFPRPIIELFGIGQVNVILLGACGVILAALGIGTLIASRSPVRHILWLRLITLLFISLAAYGGLVYWGGGISIETARALALLGIVPAVSLMILFPRSPHLVSTRVQSPDGVIYTNVDDGGLFVRNRQGGFSPYVIRLPREPALPNTTHRRPNLARVESAAHVMIVGSGAREHAFADAVRWSDGLEKLYVAPGNGGTAAIAENLPIAASDVDSIVQAAQERNVELVIIGPEDPLARGLGNALRDAGILCLGPTREAARLEWSKSFAKRVMDDAGVPTAAWAQFDDYSEAADYLRAHPFPRVIKADGLAAGKGVAVCETEPEALRFLHHVMRLRDFGDAGSTVIIEEALTGVEMSVFALCAGEQMLFLPPACDYKRAFDDDAGPNTGGMGAYSPPEFLTDRLMADIRDTIIRPVLRRMVELGAPFNGILYAGLMITDDGPKVIEFNSRLGDPEAQVVLPRITSDFLQLATAAAAEQLDGVQIDWAPRPAVGVAIVPLGYPGNHSSGQAITGLNRLDYDVSAFHAGTQLDQESGQLVTAGGRILTLTALGDTMAEARDKAYENVARVRLQGARYRTDIAQRAVSALDSSRPAAIPALRANAIIGANAHGMNTD